MSNVLLIYPPINFKNKIAQTLDVDRPPLGLLYLASSLEKNNISVRVVDVGAQKISLEDIILIIEKEQCSIVGISAMTPNLQGVLQIAKKIRNKFGDKIVVGLGGAHINGDPEFINRFPDLFNFSLIGEGELTFPKLVKKILNKEPFERINFGEIVSNLDDIPFPARHLARAASYQRNIGMITSRGCPYACIFCCIPAISKKVRFRSVENIVEEMERNVSHCQGEFVFEDDAFTLKKEHTFKLCQEILRRKIKARWSAITRADLVDEPLLEQMHRAGCYELFYGIESGSARIRNQIVQKKLSDDQIFKAISLCNKVGIKSSAYLMLGFPTETKQDLYQTVNFPLKLKMNVIGIHLTHPMPGSALFKTAQEDGLLSKDIIDKFANQQLGEGFRGVWPIYVPKGLSLKDLYKARRIGYYKFYFRPKYIFKRLLTDSKSWKQLKTDIKVAISLLRYGRSEVSP